MQEHLARVACQASRRHELTDAALQHAEVAAAALLQLVAATPRRQPQLQQQPPLLADPCSRLPHSANQHPELRVRNWQHIQASSWPGVNWRKPLSPGSGNLSSGDQLCTGYGRRSFSAYAHAHAHVHAHESSEQQQHHNEQQQQQEGHDSHGRRKRSHHPSSAFQALQHGVRSHVAKFMVTPEQAAQQFDRYQLQQCMGFQVSGLLKGVPLTPVYLPYWSFNATISARYSCQLQAASTGTGASASASGADGKWESSGWVQLLDKAHMGHETEVLQVCASYRHTRQLTQAGGKAAATVAAAATSDTVAGSAGSSSNPHSSDTGNRPLTTHEATTLKVSVPAFVCGGRATSTEAGSNYSSSNNKDTDASGSRKHPASGSGHGETLVPVEDPVMPQGLAWHLALTTLTRQLVQEASQHAASQQPQHRVRDVYVDVKVHSHSPVLVYVPVYLAHYQYGTRYKQGTGGVITPHMFDALLSGTDAAVLSATRHISPAKAAAAGGAAAASVVLGTIASMHLLIGSGSAIVAAWGAWAAEAAAAALMGGALAGSWAKGLPQSSKNKTAFLQAAADQDFYSRYDKLQQQLQQASSTGQQAGSTKVPDELNDPDDAWEAYMLWLWSDADWRRWEGEEPWNWDPAAKQAEAEALWRRQMARPVERQRHREMQQLAAERERQAEEQGWDAGGWRQGRAHGAQGWSRSRLGHSHGHRIGTRDFLGYYKILGLDVSAAATSADGGDAKTLGPDDIKSAFKAQAMLLHPDRFISAAEDERQQAHVKFQKLQMAYDVLKDAEKRKMYDRGQLIH